MLTLTDCLPKAISSQHAQPSDQDSVCHVLIASSSYVDDAALCCTGAQALLSPNEHRHLARLTSPRARQEYLMTRATLRRYLGLISSTGAGALEFKYGPYGKPELEAASGDGHDLFNLSHTKNVIVFGFSADSKLGIDVEHLSPDLDIASLAKAALNSDERGLLMRRPHPQRAAAFLRLWTAKEALIKVHGGSISEAPEIFTGCGLSLADVEQILSGHPYLLRWSEGFLRNLRLSSTVTAALAVATKASNLSLTML